jgi:hypothetical protein
MPAPRDDARTADGEDDIDAIVQRELDAIPANARLDADLEDPQAERHPQVDEPRTIRRTAARTASPKSPSRSERPAPAPLAADRPVRGGWVDFGVSPWTGTLMIAGLVFCIIGGSMAESAANRDVRTADDIEDQFEDIETGASLTVLGSLLLGMGLVMSGVRGTGEPALRAGSFVAGFLVITSSSVIYFF